MPPPRSKMQGKRHSLHYQRPCWSNRPLQPLYQGRRWGRCWTACTASQMCCTTRTHSSSNWAVGSWKRAGRCGHRMNWTWLCIHISHACPCSSSAQGDALPLVHASLFRGSGCEHVCCLHNIATPPSPSPSTPSACRWVPPLFGLAGIIIGVSVPLLDRFIFKDQGTPTSGAAVAAGPSSLQAASWPAVLLCISLFVSQYGLSGFLERQLTASLADQSLLGLPASDVALSAILWAYAAAHLTAFDRSKSVLLMAALTAVCGPLIECALINGPGLYTYTHPTMAGIPLWIAPVYFAGGPAVGGLGKRVWEDLSAQEERAKHR